MTALRIDFEEWASLAFEASGIKSLRRGVRGSFEWGARDRLRGRQERIMDRSIEIFNESYRSGWDSADVALALGLHVVLCSCCGQPFSEFQPRP